MARRALVTSSAATESGHTLAACLADPDIGGFDVEHLIDPTAEQLAVAAETFVTRLGPDDTALVHYSGPAAVIGGGLRLLVGGVDASEASPISSSFDVDLLHEISRSSACGRFAILLDCDESALGVGDAHGTVIDPTIVKRALPVVQGRWVLASMGALEVDPAAEGPSWFIRSLVDGLCSGRADCNGDGTITIDEAHQHVVAAAPLHPGGWAWVTPTSAVSGRSGPPFVLGRTRAGPPLASRSRLAPPSTRLAARAIDVVISAGLMGATALVVVSFGAGYSHPGGFAEARAAAAELALPVAWLVAARAAATASIWLYEVVPIAMWGTTIGKWLFHNAVGLPRDRGVRWRIALLRALLPATAASCFALPPVPAPAAVDAVIEAVAVVTVLVVCCNVPLLFTNRRRQTVWDRVARTFVHQTWRVRTE